jgi:hypothetical protein
MEILPPFAIPRARRLAVIGGRVDLIVTRPRELLAKNVRIARPPLPVSIAFTCLFLWAFAIQWMLLRVDSWVPIVFPEAIVLLAGVQFALSQRHDFVIKNGTLLAGVCDAKTRRIRLDFSVDGNKSLALFAPSMTDWNALVASLPTAIQPGPVRGPSRALTVLFLVALAIAFASAGFLLKALGIK